MPTETKVQIIFAIILSLEMLGLFMIIIRTVANLEHAFNRVEEIVHREVQIAFKHKNQEKIARENADHDDKNKGKKNDLLLNIPFMERLSKEKKNEKG